MRIENSLMQPYTTTDGVGILRLRATTRFARRRAPLRMPSVWGLTCNRHLSISSLLRRFSFAFYFRGFLDSYSRDAVAFEFFHCVAAAFVFEGIA
jgi:hypothetical protein